MTQAELSVKLEQAQEENARLLEEAQRSRRQLQEITDAAPAGIIQLDLSGRVVFANRPFLERMGLEPQEVLGRSLADVLGPEAFSSAAEHFARAKEGSTETFEQERFIKGEGFRIVRISYGPQRDAQGRVIGVIGVSVDVTSSRRAEAELRDNDRHFRLALEAAEMGFWDWNVLEDRARWSLPRLGAWAEPPRGEGAAFQQLLPFLHEDDRARFEQTVSRALSYGGSFECEFRVRLPELGVYWLAARGHVFFSTAGRAVRVIGVVRDTTVRRQADEERERLVRALETKHEALRGSEERYRSLFQNNPQSLLVYDAETRRFLAVNDAAVEHYGYSREEFLRLTVADLKPPEDLGKLPKPGDRRLRRRHRGRHVKKDGTIIDVDIVSHAIELDGRLARLVLVHDLTERNRAERRAQAEQRERLMIFDAVPAMIWYKDTKNRILRCNRAAAASIGRSVAELEGKSVTSVYPDEAASYYRDDLDVIRTGKPKFGIIEQLLTSTGEKRWVQTAKLPHFDETGEVGGVVVFSVDITERKRVEDVLRESERAQREFVANVSHEFRTPVAAIKGFAETLRRGGLEDAKNRLRFVRIIERHAQRLGGLIESLLTLSTIEAGVVKLEPLEIELKTLAEEYVESIAALSRRKDTKVRVLVRPGLRVVADEAMLLQVLENLLGNALKFQRPGGRIDVSARAEGDRVRVTVADQGPGISPRDLPRIFERFYKGAGAGGAFGSTGLGLHLVKKIVEAHGGRVWAESRLGRGSSFHFTLPRAS